MSYSRQPRCYANGIPVIEAEVHVHLHQSANTFRARLPMDLCSGWIDQQSLSVTITGSSDGGGGTTLITGNADEVEVDLEKRFLDVRGRDATAKLIDSKTNESWSNQSASSIIQKLAGTAGLGASVQGAGQMAGRQFDQDYTEISDQDSAWNKIVSLARSLGCIAFVHNNTVMVQPYGTFTGGGYVVTYSQPPDPKSNAIQIRLIHNKNLAKGVSTKVSSYRHKQGDIQQSTSTSGGGGGGGLNYVFRTANMTKDQTENIAKAHTKEQKSHEKHVRITMPGDTSINPTMGLTLVGTGTSFDMQYIINDITHRFSWQGGYVMEIDASNDGSGGSGGAGSGGQSSS